MALVLKTKYPAGAYFIFLTNRALRLFPTYFCVLILTLALCIFKTPSFVGAWKDLSGAPYVAALASQAAIFGQDVLQFVTLPDGRVIRDITPVPQAWTLSIELMFYLIAPFIVRRSPGFVVTVLIASLVLRLFLQFVFDLDGDPWSYRFFPSELALFLCGAFGYQVFKGEADQRVLIFIATLVGACLLENRWNGLGRVVSVAFLVCAISAIPRLFAITRQMKLDQNLGALSYPLYICHFIPIWVLEGMTIHPLLRGMLVVTGSMVLAVALYVLVERHIDLWRHRHLIAGRRHEVPRVCLQTPEPS